MASDATVDPQARCYAGRMRPRDAVTAVLHMGCLLAVAAITACAPGGEPGSTTTAETAAAAEAGVCVTRRVPDPANAPAVVSFPYGPESYVVVGGSYRYLFTYVGYSAGETLASPPTAPIIALEDHNYRIAGAMKVTVPNSSELNVGLIAIYRTTNGGSTFYRVGAVVNGPAGASTDWYDNYNSDAYAVTQPQPPTTGLSVNVRLNDAQFCAALGKSCGTVTSTECGYPRTVNNCGSCSAPQSCGGDGVPNVCGNPDHTPPTISITSPQLHARVAGSFTFSAAVTDDFGVAGVQLELDGAHLGAELTAPPYSIGLSAATLGLGAHTLTVVARDGAGNTAAATSAIEVVPGIVDLDGDGASDLTFYRPSQGLWAVLKSSAGYTTSSSYSWGIATDVTVAGDYDGDRKTDLAVFRPSTGTWWVLSSSSNYTTSSTHPWGLAADVTVPGDYDGDGKTDPAVFRPSTGQWFVLESSSNYTTFSTRPWGLATDVTVPGDYDGDGKTDPAVFRPSTGQWFILFSSAGYTTYSLGLATDVPVPGDYDGDGKTDPAVFRPSTGQWTVLPSSHGYATPTVYAWGVATDVPVPGDYDGDGKSDPAVFRPSTGRWFALKSSTGYATYLDAAWGVGTDVPINRRP